MTVEQATQPAGTAGQGSAALKAIVFAMFAMFAMTTDSVGTIIPEIIREFHMGLTAAGSFQYASMAGIGLSAIFLGMLADRIGRKRTILLGLLLYGASCALFVAGHDFLFLVGLLFIGGLGIGIFKTGALALIGDISGSTREHAATMNLVEGFFGVGAIIGPAAVAWFLHAGMTWKWVYLIAAALCLTLFAGALIVRFPARAAPDGQPSSLRETVGMMRDPVALSFALALMLYVGSEAAIYVWAPTYLATYTGADAWLAAYAVAIFFVLRSAGRFLGAWLLARLDWTAVLLACTLAMALLLWVSVLGGRGAAIYALPLTGLFMSVQYPTINSTGISCYRKPLHGAVAGVLLFFTCVSAVLSPLAMALLGDGLGDSRYSISLGAVMASALAFLCLFNWLRKPFAARLAQRNGADYTPS